MDSCLFSSSRQINNSSQSQRFRLLSFISRLALWFRLLLLVAFSFNVNAGVFYDVWPYTSPATYAATAQESCDIGAANVGWYCVSVEPYGTGYLIGQAQSPGGGAQQSRDIYPYTNSCIDGTTHWDTATQACIADPVCTATDASGNLICKNEGPPRSCAEKGGNPIHIGVGNKYQKEPDLVSTSIFGLSFSRFYNSMEESYDIQIGRKWLHSYGSKIQPIGTGPQYVYIHRANGRQYGFTNPLGTWVVEDGNIHDTLEQLTDTGGNTTGWKLTSGETVELYGASGQLQSITDIRGNTQTLTYIGGRLDTVETNIGESLTFGYDTQNRISSVSDNNTPARIWGYRYDASNNLEFADNPDGTTRQYHYENAMYPNALTGITDERGLRYANWEYDVNGLATTSYHGPTDLTPATLNDRIEGVSVVYNADNTRTVTNSKGIPSTYNTTSKFGTSLVTDINGPACTTCGSSDSSYQYDANNNTLAKTENGITTRYGNYDAKGNYQCKVEGITAVDTTDFVLTPCGFDPVASPNARRTDYTYDPRFHRKVLTQTESSVFSGGNKVTTYSYDAFGNRTSVTVTGFMPDGTAVNRSTTMAYTGTLNQLSFIDSPRLDVNDHTTFDYYLNEVGQGDNRARLKSVTDANSVFVRNNIQYTPTGKVLSEDRPNGLSLSYSYYPGNDRLQTLTETAGASSHVTHWSYLATGEVQSITQGYGSPAASTLSFGYDAARHLTRITDGLGNYIKYTLDTEGNKEKEEIFDANGTPASELDDVLKKQFTQSFDVYNRLNIVTQITGTTNEVTDNDFSPDGTLAKVTDGNNGVTDYGYDDLERLLTSTHDFGTNVDTSDDLLTQYGYDIADRLTFVTDPNGNATTYVYDDLGNLISQTSPDTGTTTFSYDAAGNLKTRTEGVNTPDVRTTNYSYDALNRMTSINAPGTGDDISYTYDTCLNGSGRLCKVQTGSLTTFYQYDGFGQVTGHQGTSYGYDTAGRIISITYPSDAQLTYGYDAVGQINQADLTINGQTQILASNILYAPFGPMTNLTYGNGQVLSQTFDTAYRSTGITIPGVLNLTQDLYDGNGNLKQRTDVLATAIGAFNYDAANRLDIASGIFGNRDYDYDKNGNRSQLIADTITTPYDYEPLGAGTVNNRLRQIGTTDVFSNVFGNTLSQGNWSYSYTVHNRLSTATQGATLQASFVYNGLGQRQQKTDEVNATGRYFLYGLNGELLAETDGQGNVLKEYIYLNGVPLVVFEPDDDADGLTNAEEAITGTNPINVDSDGDSLLDTAEWFQYGTDSNNADTDGDGINDNIEIIQGTDPNNGQTYPGDGDVTQDGVINLGDLLLVTQFATNIKTPTVEEFLHADINQDGVINVVDVLLLQKQLLVIALFGPISTPTVAYTQPSASQDTIFASLMNMLFPKAEAALPINAGKLYYIHNDHLGTTQKLTDEIGTIVWSATHDPFGKATVDVSSTIAFNLRFPGQYYDSETNLHYNYYRTYDPETGRYLTSDPIGLKGGVNTYAYVLNNPIRYTDPLGLEITGSYDGFDATVTGWEYTGLTAHLERGPNGNILVDRLGYFNFLISGSLGVNIKCKETDDCGNVKREWTLGGSVSVNDIAFRVPYDEPAIPIPGMGYVIMADKIWRVSQYMNQWRGLIETAGKGLLNTPTLICKGYGFFK